MIAYLRGTLLVREGESALVVAHGVGYELRMPASALDRLVGRGSAPGTGTVGAGGMEVELYVHTAVREDAIDLYGFATLPERVLFRLLLGVPKVGPGLALLIMSALSASDIARAVQHQDPLAFTRVKGIGKKTAENLLFHLKDRALEIAATASEQEATSAPARGGFPSASGPQDELIAALVALGYRTAQAEDAAQRARERLPDAGLDPLVREALRVLRQA
jgi:Holliday junction DNA helicase RuvA